MEKCVNYFFLLNASFCLLSDHTHVIPFLTNSDTCVWKILEMGHVALFIKLSIFYQMELSV